MDARPQNELRHIQNEERQPHPLVRVDKVRQLQDLRRLMPLCPPDKDDGPRDEELQGKVHWEPSGGEY